MRYRATALILLAALMLNGCVLHIGRDGDHDDDQYDSVHALETRNREAISRLALGSSLDQVRSQFGDPDFTEASLVDGQEIRVLRYRTHRTHSDGDTTRDETTPLVFEDGKLVGIGERAAAEAMRAGG